MASQCCPVDHQVMSIPPPSIESIAFRTAAPSAAANTARPLFAGLLVYCSTVSLSVAAAAALVSGVPAELLLASF